MKSQNSIFKIWLILIKALMVALLWISFPAAAHKPSDSYLIINVDKTNATAQFDIALRDLDFVIGLDHDSDNQITWGELRQSQSAVVSYALSRLSIRADSKQCTPKLHQLMFDTHSDGGYAVLMIDLNCGKLAEKYEVDYRLFFDVDRLHKNILIFNYNKQTETAVLSVDKHLQVFTEQQSRLKQWKNFVEEGIWHIWTGFDHILFIISLLLPAVMIKEGHGWKPAKSFKEVTKDALVIVTAFTLSHSITLTLAALQIVSLPSRLVESCIALTVIISALNNLYPVIHRNRWIVTFGFGLIHGFGFASSLLELGLPTTALLLSIFGFNIGVEIGQVIIVLLFLPMAFYLRNRPAYLNVFLRAGSIIIVIIAIVWFIQRAFNL